MIARRAENPSGPGSSAAAGEEERPREALTARPTTRLDVWENEGGALAREPKQGHEQGVLTIPGSVEQLVGCPPSKGRGVTFFPRRLVRLFT